MSLDNELKKAFERHSLEQDATPEAWAGVEQKVRRSHRRQAITTGVLTVALLVGAASLVPMLAGNDEAPRDHFATADPTESGTPQPVADRYVVLNDGAIELRATATGDVIRTLVARNADQRRMDLRVGGGYAYWVEVADEANYRCGEIFRVSLDGGDPSKVADGSGVAIQRDGQKLAYVGRGEGSRCAEQPIVVRDLETGDERTWEWRAYQDAYPFPDQTSVGQLAWHPNGRDLLFGIGVGDPADEFFLLDTSKGDDILDARNVDSEGNASEGNYLSSPRFTDDGRLLMAERAGQDLDQPVTVWTIDLATGRKLEKLLTVDFNVPSFDVRGDASLILTRVDYGDGSERYSTYLWDGEGAPKVIAEDGGVVAW